MGIHEATHFHERIAAVEDVAVQVAQAFIVNTSGNEYSAATLQTDGIGPAFIVFDAGTGTYRLNDNGSGAERVAYFADSNVVMV